MRAGNFGKANGQKNLTPELVAPCLSVSYLLTALFLSGACSRILTSIELASEDEERSTAAGFSMLQPVSRPDLPISQQAGALCSPGNLRCTGQALQVCTDAGKGWVTLEICASAALCRIEPSTCDIPVCGFGEFRCEGERLELCDADRTGFQLVEICPGAAYCSTRENRCTTDACEVGERQCSGAALQTCGGAEVGWETGPQCVSQAICEQSLGDNTESFQCSVAVCSVGERRCSGPRLEQCNTEQTGWIVLDTCSSRALCSAEQSACLPRACTVGELQCNEAGALQRCDSDQTGFEIEQQCLSSAFCSTLAGSEGCNEQPCIEGEVRCNGPQIERCRLGRTGFDRVGDPCATAELCSINTQSTGPAASCREPECAPNQYQCVGNELQRCNEGRTGYIPSDQCDTAELCSSILQRCEPARCEPEASRCVGSALEVCNLGRTGFVLQQTCGSPAECDSVAGVCTGSCVEGTRRCNDAVLEECRSRTEGWQQIAFCESAGLCNVETNRCEVAVCRAGEQRCEGVSLQVCASGLDKFDEQQMCASSELCDALAGQCDTCTPGAGLCEGDVLMQCSGDGQLLQQVQNCGVALCQVDASGARCLECQPDTQRCDGEVVRGCSAQGQETEVERCATAAQCAEAGVGSERSASCAAPICALGQRECGVAGEVLACNSTRSGFASQVPPVVCPATTQCDAELPGGCTPVAGAGTLPPVPVLQEGLPPYRFVTILSQDGSTVLDQDRSTVRGLGPLIVEVPSDWSNTSSIPWLNSAGRVLGPGLVATSDATEYSQGFGVPGVSLGATNSLGTDVAVALDLLGLETVCRRRQSRGDFDNNGHRGLVEFWIDCGTTGASAVAVTAAPPEGDYIVFVLVKLLAARDRDAVDRILATFTVGN